MSPNANEQKNMSAFLVLTNIVIWEKICSFFELEDLKTCRLVCSFWNWFISNLDTFSSKLPIVFDGELEVDSYLKNSKNKSIKTYKMNCELHALVLQQFCTKSSEKLNTLSRSSFVFANITEQYMNYFLNKNTQKHIGIAPIKIQLQQSIEKITAITLFDVCFESSVQFYEFLNQFPSVRSLGIHRCTITTNPKPHDHNFLHYSHEKFQHGSRQNPILTLRKISIKESSITQHALLVLRQLLYGDCQLEEYEVIIERVEKNFMIGGTRLSQVFERNIKTLKRVVLHWDYENSGISMFPLIFSPSLCLPFGPAPLQHLDIHCPDFKPHALYFRVIVLQWIQSFKNLVELKLSTVHLPDVLGFVIKNLFNNGCKIRVGVFITESAHPVEVRTLRSGLCLPMMKEILTTIDFRYATNLQDGYEKLFPIDQGTDSTDIGRCCYSSVKKLRLNFSTTPTGRLVKSFDASSVAKLFPNLTSLEITGRVNSEELSEFQDIQALSDAELQLILKSLVKLQNIRIQANLLTITDFGMTGRQKTSIFKQYEPGCSFSNLKHLRTLRLLYLGTKITNKTLKYGFNNMYYLKYVEILGSTKINKKGIKRLRKQYLSRIEIQIN